MGGGEEHGKYILQENKSIHKASKIKTRNIKHIKLQQVLYIRGVTYFICVKHRTQFRTPGNVVKLL